MGTFVGAHLSHRSVVVAVVVGGAVVVALLETLACVPTTPPSCTAVECGADAECRDGLCVSLDAGPDDVVDAGSCSTTEECGPLHVCRGGVCAQVTCAGPCDCGAGEFCDPVAFHCTAASASCDDSAGCPCNLACSGFTHACFDQNGGQ